MSKVLLFISFLLFGILSNSFPQESTLLLRNGKELIVSDFAIDGADYYTDKITFTNNNGKQKKKYLEDVFSITDANGKEDVLYKSNVEFGEILTPEQMKQYTLGFGKSNEMKISPFIIIGGIASGVGAAFIPSPNVELGSSTMGVPLGILVPVAYVSAIGATTPSAESIHKRLPEKVDGEYYLMGLQDGIQKKRLKNSIIGSLIGFASGFAILTLTN